MQGTAVAGVRVVGMLAEVSSGQVGVLRMGV